MLSFGWVTQDACSRGGKANTLLTNLIKNYLRNNEYVQFRDNDMNNRNCLKHKKNGQHIVIYTRDKNGENKTISWAIYEYVKKMAKNKEKLVLILGVLEDDSVKGKLYCLNKEEILGVTEKKELTREQYYVTSEKEILEMKTWFPFNNKKEMEECLESIINENGV